MINKGNWNYLEDKRILITGGTGSLGHQLTHEILQATKKTRVIILSRDEFKQYRMREWLAEVGGRRSEVGGRRSEVGGRGSEVGSRVSFFLGDVRDVERLKRAFSGVDYVIHTAALKQVPAAEYNPFEFIKTNVMGAENVINAAIDCGVQKVVALSTDKAANPINLYGATKLCSDKLFVAGNCYSGKNATRFSVVRYGNVVGSRGSVIPFFLREYKKGVLPITDERMTRFWITLEQGANLVLNALSDMHGGEIWVPRIPSMRIVDLARVIAPECEHRIVGIRPGEKLHEVMVSVDDARQTLEFDNHYIIKPAYPWWGDNWHIEKGARACADGFYVGSDNNTSWLTEEHLKLMIASLDFCEAETWVDEHR